MIFPRRVGCLVPILILGGIVGAKMGLTVNGVAITVTILTLVGWGALWLLGEVLDGIDLGGRKPAILANEPSHDGSPSRAIQSPPTEVQDTQFPARTLAESALIRAAQLAKYEATWAAAQVARMSDEAIEAMTRRMNAEATYINTEISRGRPPADAVSAARTLTDKELHAWFSGGS